MKKKSYKTPKGGAFRTYFHGSRLTNGASFRRVTIRDGKQGRKGG